MLLALGGCRQPRDKAAELLLPAPADGAALTGTGTGQHWPSSALRRAGGRGWHPHPPGAPRGVFLRPSTKYCFFKGVWFFYLVGDMDFKRWEERHHNVKRGGRAYNQQHLKLLNIRRALRAQPELHGDPQSIIKTDIFILLAHGLSHTTRVHRPALSTRMWQGLSITVPGCSRGWASHKQHSSLPAVGAGKGLQ